MDEIFLRGKTNTEILIIIVFVLLLLLFIVGKFLTNKEQPNNKDICNDNERDDDNCHSTNESLDNSEKDNNKSIRNESAKKTLVNKKDKVSKVSMIIAALLPAPILATILSLISPVSTYALCPVCVGGVAAGLGLAKFLGIDDLITGLWLGAMLVAIIMLTEEWFAKKGWLNKLGKIRLILIALITIASVIYPLYSLDYINFHFDHVLWGIDKLLVGPAFGLVGFVSGYLLDMQIKRNNRGKARFPFQRVIIPVGIIWLLTVAGYFILYY